jgi:hypothetical protein
VSDPSSEQLRKILNNQDIELLTERFLSTLKDLQSGSDPVELSRVYEKMGLGAYNLPIAMQFIIQEYLIPRRAVKVIDNKVKITPKGETHPERMTDVDDKSMEKILQKISSALETNAKTTLNVLDSISCAN